MTDSPMIDVAGWRKIAERDGRWARWAGDIPVQDVVLLKFIEAIEAALTVDEMLGRIEDDDPGGEWADSFKTLRAALRPFARPRPAEALAEEVGALQEALDAAREHPGVKAVTDEAHRSEQIPSDLMNQRLDSPLPTTADAVAPREPPLRPRGGGVEDS